MNKQAFKVQYFANLAHEKGRINGVPFQNEFANEAEKAWKAYSSNLKSKEKEEKKELRPKKKRKSE